MEYCRFGIQFLYTSGVKNVFDLSAILLFPSIFKTLILLFTVSLY